jgi:DegV family protein with EDD domain
MSLKLVTDSNAQLPDAFALCYEVLVVPIVILLDGAERREGNDIDADEFYELLPTIKDVTTSQPSPGEFVEVYQRAVSQGATEIVSVHLGSELSGTLNSARLAAQQVDVPVHLVDTGLTSFSVSCAVFEAASARSAGGDAAACVQAALAVCPDVHNVFVMGGLDLARGSGRVTIDDEIERISAEGVPVFAIDDGALEVLGNADDLAGAALIMRDVIAATSGPVRVGVGVADRALFGFYDKLEALLDEADNVVDVIRYRCGPSVGAFTGAGTAGACWYQIPSA